MKELPDLYTGKKKILNSLNDSVCSKLPRRVMTRIMTHTSLEQRAQVRSIGFDLITFVNRIRLPIFRVLRNAED